MQRRF